MPPAIYRYWQGGEPPMEPWLGSVVRATHHDRNVVDLGWDDISGYSIPATVPEDDERQWARHVSNVVRWRVLYEHGGTYLDHDVIPLRRLPLDRNWIAEHGGPCTCAISIPEPRHEFAEQVLDAIYSVKKQRRSETASGELLVARLLFDQLDTIPLMFNSNGTVLDPESPLIHAWHKIGA